MKITTLPACLLTVTPDDSSVASAADCSRAATQTTTHREWLSTAATCVAPGFSTLSTDFGLFCVLLHEPLPWAAGAWITVQSRRACAHPLTSRRAPRYNRQACALACAGAPIWRNQREAYIPAEQSEACEDARFPQAHVYEGRPRSTRRPSPQGPQGP